MAHRVRVIAVNLVTRVQFPRPAWWKGAHRLLQVVSDFRACTHGQQVSSKMFYHPQKMKR